MLSGKDCFEGLSKYVLADKIAKHEFMVIRQTEILNRKSRVLDKFKNYGKQKEEKRLKLANVGSKKRQTVDPLKQDKEFLEKMAVEFNTKDATWYRYEYVI